MTDDKKKTFKILIFPEKKNEVRMGFNSSTTLWTFCIFKNLLERTVSCSFQDLAMITILQVLTSNEKYIN